MITPDTLQRIADCVAGAPNEAALPLLKQHWPDLRFTFCSEEDIPARLPPMLQCAGFNLYLIGGGEHCLSLTTDHEQAIGVVVADTV